MAVILWISLSLLAFCIILFFLHRKFIQPKQISYNQQIKSQNLESEEELEPIINEEKVELPTVSEEPTIIFYNSRKEGQLDRIPSRSSLPSLSASRTELCTSFVNIAGNRRSVAISEDKVIIEVLQE